MGKIHSHMYSRTVVWNGGRHPWKSHWGVTKVSVKTLPLKYPFGYPFSPVDSSKTVFAAGRGGFNAYNNNVVWKRVEISPPINQQMLTTSLLQITFTENFCHRHGENPLSHVRLCNDVVLSVAQKRYVLLRNTALQSFEQPAEPPELLFGAGGDTPENHTAVWQKFLWKV